MDRDNRIIISNTILITFLYSVSFTRIYTSNSYNQETIFIEQLICSRKKIQESFKRSHEALRVREDNLLSRVDEIEKDYNRNSKELQQILESLNDVKSLTVVKLINSKIDELTADIDTSIELKWNSLFEIDIEQLGNNYQTK